MLIHYVSMPFLHYLTLPFKVTFCRFLTELHHSVSIDEDSAEAMF